MNISSITNFLAIDNLGPKVIGSLAVIAIFFIIYLLNNFVFRSIRARSPEYLARPINVIRAFIRILIIIIGIIALLDRLGVDIITLIASFGVTGFIITFALKDMLTSILSGAMVMFYRPFKVGDRIRVATIEGTVKRIDLQYTILVDKDREYNVPNNKVAAEAVIIKDLLRSTK